MLVTAFISNLSPGPNLARRNAEELQRMRAKKTCELYFQCSNFEFNQKLNFAFNHNHQPPRPSRTTHTSLSQRHKSYFNPHFLCWLPLCRPRHQRRSLAVWAKRLFLPGSVRPRSRIRVRERTTENNTFRPRRAQWHAVGVCRLWEESHPARRE